MPLRKDPTRTTTLRKRFIADLNRRVRAFKRAIREALVDKDALGLTTEPALNVEQGAWRFQTSPQKVASFRRWAQQQIDSGLASVKGGEPWLATYVESAYRQGIVNAYAATRRGVGPSLFDGTSEEFVRSAFAQPERMSKLQMLVTRTFEDLKGVTDAMAQQISRELADGLLAGDHPRAIARRMGERIDGLSRRRAQVIARTELSAAHSEGQLDSFEELGVEDVGIQAEWSTAEDSKVCPLCRPLEGKVMKVSEARGLIPRHPQCRCAWVPALDEPTKKQKRELARAIKASVKREKRSRWAGKGLA